MAPVHRPQYTPQQRQFIYSNYHKFKGTRGCYTKICSAFTDKFPGVRVPSKNLASYIYTKQEAHFTVHNLNSKKSPGVSFSGRRRLVKFLID